MCAPNRMPCPLQSSLTAVLSQVLAWFAALTCQTARYRSDAATTRFGSEPNIDVHLTSDELAGGVIMLSMPSLNPAAPLHCRSLSVLLAPMDQGSGRASASR